MIASISCLFTLGSKGYFFLIDLTVGSRRSCVNKARALLNREHGSFHLRYSENGPLEPGYCLLGSHPKWKPRVVWQQWTAAGFNTHLQTVIVGVRISQIASHFLAIESEYIYCLHNCPILFTVIDHRALEPPSVTTLSTKRGKKTALSLFYSQW